VPSVPLFTPGNSCKVLIKSGDKVFHSGKTHDLSMRGLFVQTKDKIPIGEECDLTMILGGLDQSIQFKLKALETMGNQQTNNIYKEYFSPQSL